MHIGWRRDEEKAADVWALKLLERISWSTSSSEPNNNWATETTRKWWEDAPHLHGARSIFEKIRKDYLSLWHWAVIIQKLEWLNTYQTLGMKRIERRQIYWNEICVDACNFDDVLE